MSRLRYRSRSVQSGQLTYYAQTTQTTYLGRARGEAMKTFYSVEEVADATGYSAATVRNWIRDGDLFAIQSAKRGAFRVPASALEKRLGDLGIGRELTVSVLP